MNAKTESEAREKVWELIKDIRYAQLVTHGVDGSLHARPMAAVERTEDDRLWFFTSATSPKIAEIAKDPRVLLSYSEPDKNNYVSISGTAEAVRDHALIQRLWKEPLRTWFPKGADDPNIALICVHAESAEYWDSPSSAFVYAYGYVKARLTGEASKGGENETVRLGAA